MITKEYITSIPNDDWQHHLENTLCPKLSDKTLRLFAVACARECLRDDADPRSVNAVNVAERYALGKATVEELDAAYSAADDAWNDAYNAADDAADNAVMRVRREALSSTKSAVWSTTESAAESAVYAAWNAARSAAYAAEDAADAARSAAIDRQKALLIEVIEKHEKRRGVYLANNGEEINV